MSKLYERLFLRILDILMGIELMGSIWYCTFGTIVTIEHTICSMILSRMGVPIVQVIILTELACRIMSQNKFAED